MLCSQIDQEYYRLAQSNYGKDLDGNAPRYPSTLTNPITHWMSKDDSANTNWDPLKMKSNGGNMQKQDERFVDIVVSFMEHMFKE